MTDFRKLKIAVLATDGFEESELVEPVHTLRNAGATVDIIAPPIGGRTGKIQAFHHHDKTIKVPVSSYLGDPAADPDLYDGLVLPGGALNADQMRALPAVLKFIEGINVAEKPVAAICHAPWELISAGLVKERRLTSYHTIQDDIRNAGGIWLDAEVVVDRNWVTSRQPSDLPAFIRETMNLLSQPIPLISEEARRAAARARIA